ncbi:stage V sporulation protein AB [Clostridium sp. Cult2]|uniref:stage V sporulation protein AB n=1 Tax=Clostridium sp. Cult2 TaxID=2079003 RepID=UPI001F2D6CC0|nr:stage V sporulation protein AB [Clostridium sp. Cult2]MCF6466473.1 stage V sporulation protein AC [Clostridium sp. Cult2]
MFLGGERSGKVILIFLIGVSTGITVGSAAAAFLTLLKIVPRVTQVTETKEYIKLYEYVIIIGGIIASLIYFSDVKLSFSKYFCVPVGIIIGVFYGLFASALAEILNVIPVFAKKFKAKHELQYIIGALIFGKVLGALYYWLIFKKN